MSTDNTIRNQKERIKRLAGKVIALTPPLRGLEK